jgi:hypothetical protein
MMSLVVMEEHHEVKQECFKDNDNYVALKGRNHLSKSAPSLARKRDLYKNRNGEDEKHANCDEDTAAIKGEDQMFNLSTPSVLTRGHNKGTQNKVNKNNAKDDDDYLGKGEFTLKIATPSVIRKGLFVVRNESKLSKFELSQII